MSAEIVERLGAHISLEDSDVGGIGGIDQPRLEQAAALGREYGVEAKRQGLSLGEAAQAFLFFRARFLAEIANVARRRSLEPKPAAALFAEADRALDVVILALIDGHRATGAP